jgi:hypothetical protein
VPFKHSDLTESKGNGGWPKHFETVRDVQQYVNSITKSPFWKEMGGVNFVRVKPVSNRNNARGWISFVEIPPWAYSKPVILHELAHSLTAKLDLSAPDHGPLFVLLFRRLIEQELGIDERRRFDLNAERERVSWSPRNFGTILQNVG